MKSLFASNIIEILSVLMLAGDESTHQSDIAAKAGLRLIQTQRALQRLSEAGLVRVQAKGNMLYYKLDQTHPLYMNIKDILYRTVLISEPLKAVFKKVLKEIEIVFIYGSIANGTESSESDLDLFVVGNIGLKKLSGILSPIAKQLKREINPVVYKKNEFINKIKSKDHFIITVLDSKHLWIVGDENELRTMVK